MSNLGQFFVFTKRLCWVYYKPMEQDPNIMPEMTPVKSLEVLKQYVIRKLCLYPDGALDFMSDHYRGADVEGEALQPQLPLADAGWNQQGEFEKR